MATKTAVAATQVSPMVLQWRKFVQTKLFCWLLENITVWTITTIRTQLPEPEVSLPNGHHQTAKKSNPSLADGEAS